MVGPDRSAQLAVDALLVHPSETLRSVLERMTLNHRGIVFVCEPGRHLVGVLADGDVRRSLLDATLLGVPVGKVMNTDPIVADNVDAACDLLHRYAAVAVPIVDATNQVTAIVLDEGDGELVLRADEQVAPPARPGAAVALIPARGGSKRLPRKNLAMLGPRPLVTWAVEAALDAATIGRVIVSTDDEEIAAEARQAGAEVPWLRPSPLAADDTPTIAVVDHALSWLHEAGDTSTVAVLLEPTSPVRPRGLIDLVVRELDDVAVDAAATVTTVPHTLNPEEQLRLDGGALVPYLAERTMETRRLRGTQEASYVFTGQVYAFRPATVLELGTLYGTRCAPVVRPWHEYVDIDDADDLARAEQALRGTGPGPG